MTQPRFRCGQCGSPDIFEDRSVTLDAEGNEVPADTDEVLPCGCPALVVTDEGHQEGCVTGEFLKTLGLTPAMVDVLMVDDPAEVHTTDKMLNLVGLTQRGLAVVVSSLDPGHYRLTDAGARARAVILPTYTALKGTPTAPTAPTKG